MRVSHLEIYNEEVRDLLSGDAKARLELRESPEWGVHVRGLREFVVKSAAEMAAVLAVGAGRGGLLGFWPGWTLHWQQADLCMRAWQQTSLAVLRSRGAALRHLPGHACMPCCTALCCRWGARTGLWVPHR